MTLQRGGRNICGISIGVLSLESYFPKPPGHIKNPSSLPFTTAYEILDGITVPELLNRPSPAMVGRLIEAAQRLERQGVHAITGSCGFLALFQREIAESVRIPVFLSSLIQVPLVWQMTRAPVGVLTASAAALTARHLAGVGADGVPLEIQGLEDTQEFASVILRNERNDMDLDKVEAEVIAAGRALVARNPAIRAIVLECTDLPPFACSLQQALALPVFDLVTLSGMIHEAALRQAYKGFT
ncbi:aspartate/glutamate racemase family protein [Paracoccus aminovorans]|uniref:aspartate/glutamate racemase family protein n=1 Tax=Paracoccus aminovorans TaxID=34004 RepID=UPI00078298F1|nr:aspartate/glutamate racemase family protein [Paracoccus aminovorans]MDQ7777142.1 aspartate/glutamate racemase family protein [Paracoccus aminovorans]